MVGELIDRDGSTRRIGMIRIPQNNVDCGLAVLPQGLFAVKQERPKKETDNLHTVVKRIEIEDG